MPPKKKQEQIDLSTLPQCISENAIILCKGKKQRSDKILTRLFGEYKHFISRFSRQDVLDHAKEKNIYVDPNTLNDKQKKDPKFMESICTELTPEVIAKATKSLIEHLSVKLRIQMKQMLEKPQNQRPKQVLVKKMDQLFVVDAGFCQNQKQYEALASLNQGVKYVFVLNPVISWANAPQLPQPEDNDEGQEQDDQIKEFRELKAKETLLQTDIEHNRSVESKIEQIRKFRRQADINSSFRDCIIDIVNCEIDPYNEEQSLNEVIKSFIARLSKLNSEYGEFAEWRKDKAKQAITHQQNNQPEQAKDEEKKAVGQKVQGRSTAEILSNFVDSLFGKSYDSKQNEEDDDIEALVNGFDFQKGVTLQEGSSEQEQIPQRKGKKSQFYHQNQYPLSGQSLLQSNLHSLLQYPGLDRYMMPELPTKSEPLRKLQLSHYAQFLTPELPISEFTRRLSLIRFEEIIKELDEERKYSFRDRVYEEHHDDKSLMRELYRAMINYEDAQLIAKYSEEQDKLYLVMGYKNNQRRTNTKSWEAGWKVLPNYEAWLKYFRDNDQNMNNQSFYDIDYELIGHINDQVQAFSIPDGGILISKQSTIANSTNSFLYAIKNHHLFGLSPNKTFYSSNKSTRINHFATSAEQYETQVLLMTQTADHQTMVTSLRLQQETGSIFVQTGSERRVYTPDGYSIVYDSQENAKYKILHPTGGVSEPNSYINEKGLGMKDGVIHSVPTLQRRTEYEIIKRDDQTVIVKDENRTWIKFFEGTEYLIQDGQVSIEKKNLPFVKCSNGTIQLQINDIKILGQPNNQNTYDFSVHYEDGNNLSFMGSKITVTQLLSDIPYVADISSNKIQIQFQDERIEASFDEATYVKNGVKFNPKQKQQDFAQTEVWPKDYIEPKLYVISNDNTGVEYLSQKQLEYCLSLTENGRNNLISRIKCSQLQENVHIINRQADVSELNPKRINLDLPINLDIFTFPKTFKPKTLLEKFTVRSLIRHKNLLPQDQKHIEQIKEKKDEWLRKQRKEENEFGHKQKGDKVIEDLNRDKRVMIEFRKKEVPNVNVEDLREEAIKEWKYREKEHMTLVAQKEEEDKIRLRLSKKKKSIFEEYPALVISKKQQAEQPENYSPAGFYTHYFETSQGKQALSLMPDWVFRPKTAKVHRELDPEIVTELNNTMNKTKKQQPEEQNEQNQRYDTVDVNLKPVRQVYIKPSVFTQREIDEERDAFEQEKKAYFYHQKKRKDFDLYGNERQQKPKVASLLRTQPISEINQKYLITEAPLDRKIKIASMKNKLTSQASSMIEMRKQGPHQTLLRTLDKRNDYNALLEKRTMMVHADLNDKLQRDILITPVQAQFGYLKEGKSYQIKINVKNEDILAQRLVVKKARSINVKVMLNEMGPIALGMSRKVVVQIRADSQFLGRFSDEFEIVSKHQVYKIPVTAHILSESQFENQGVRLLPHVRQIIDVLKRKTSGLPPIN